MRFITKLTFIILTFALLPTAPYAQANEVHEDVAPTTEVSCATTLESLYETYDRERLFLAAWNSPTNRARILNLYKNGLFVDAPELGEQFVARINSILADEPNIKDSDLYKKLRTFLFFETKVFTTLRAKNVTDRVNRRVDQLKSFVGKKPANYVDIGAGEGTVAANLRIKLQLSKKNTYGLEVAHYKGDPRLTWIYYDKGRIPLPDDSMELATLLMVLHHVDDLKSVLGEAHRILKPGGELIVRETDAVDEELKLFNLVTDTMFYTTFRLDDIGVPLPVNYRSKEEWARLFNSLGFKIKRVEPVEPTNPFTPVYFVLTK